MNHEETRWKQRFTNLIKAYRQLENANKRFSELSVLEKEGLVQRFEYTFELSWKTLKDYLESQGSPVQFPRDVIKEAFSAGVIEDGETWMDMPAGDHSRKSSKISGVMARVVDFGIGSVTI
jgi:nucleotidyltransferase substrate binding protein (TIGR01987 family)